VLKTLLSVLNTDKRHKDGTMKSESEVIDISLKEILPEN
jgi:hypothetical protein